MKLAKREKNRRALKYQFGKRDINFIYLLKKYGFKMYLAEEIKAKRLKKFIDKLNKIKTISSIEFSNGKGKHKTEFRREYELVSD